MVHLLPADRSDHRVIDAERICQAIAALDSPEVIQARARQREGRVIRYRLASTLIAALLAGQ